MLDLFEGGGDDSNGGNIDDAMPRLSQEDPMLVPMEAKSEDGDILRVYIPVDWASKLVPNDVRFVSPRHLLIQAHTKGEPSQEVSVATLGRASVKDRRAIAMMKRLRDVPNLITYFDSREFPTSTFVLMEGIQGESLAVYNSKAARKLPLEECLPILVDILYAVDGLDRAGVIHPWLCEDAIYFSGGRVLLGDFANMLPLDRGDEFGPDSFTELVGSGLRTAPEMEIDGRPNGRSNTMWAVGMIFGRMCLGVVPTYEAVEKHLQMTGEAAELFLTAQPQEAQRVRMLLRRKNYIGLHSEFQGLVDMDMRKLLVGLLDPSKEARWKASEALSFATQVAKNRGIKLSGPREPVKLPEGWLDGP